MKREVTNTFIEKLYLEMEECNREYKKIKKAIEALQAICEHNYIDDGHDSHKDHYFCTKCGHMYVY